MSRIPINRILSRLEEQQRWAKLESEKFESILPEYTNSRKPLTNWEKKEISDVIVQTSEKVAELITLLDWLLSQTRHQVDFSNSYDSAYSRWGYYDWFYSQRYDYGRGSEYLKKDLKKIRPLKNEVTAWYFSIWEKLKIYRIGDDELIQRYYESVKKFNTAYKATTLTSADVKDFHESIKRLIVGELNKAFKES